MRVILPLAPILGLIASVSYNELLCHVSATDADGGDGNDAGGVDGGSCENHDSDENTNADKTLPWWKDKDMELWDMWEMLGCEEYWETPPPIHDEAAWAYMRGAYIGAVGPENSSIGLLPGSDEYGFNNTASGPLFGSGFKPGTIEVRMVEGKGRAIHATTLFKKGEMVWSDHFAACFEDGMLYRKFLASIPAHFACDIFEWAYSGPSYGVCVDLDEGALVNHAAATEANRQHWEMDESAPNVGYDREVKMHVAMVDIQPGDELLIDYRSFATVDAWELLGLGKWEYNGLKNG